MTLLYIRGEKGEAKVKKMKQQDWTVGVHIDKIEHARHNLHWLIDFIIFGQVLQKIISRSNWFTDLIIFLH
jgi:hypothetical protein